MSKKPDKDCRWCKGSGVIQGMAFAKWPCDCLEQSNKQRKGQEDNVFQDINLHDMAQIPSTWPYASTPDAFELPDWNVARCMRVRGE